MPARNKIFRIAFASRATRVTEPAAQLNANHRFEEAEEVRTYNASIGGDAGESGTMNYIAQNIREIRERISQAAVRSGRLPHEITLLAISKTFPKEAIAQAAEAGLLKFGENRVQEAERKIPQLRQIAGLEWHLVGHLQTNKAKRAAELFDIIHSVDSTRLASKLNQACLETGKVLPVLLQVDLGGEETKFGATLEEVSEMVDAFSTFPGLRLDGLMTIPPFLEQPDQVRPYFAKLRELKDRKSVV